jgi:arylsulfatase A-like enzyme
VVEAGTTCDVPVINVDFYPTFLAAAGAKPPTDHALDGASLLPLLEGKPTLARQSIFWHFPGYLDGPVPRGRDPVFRTRPVTVIRKGSEALPARVFSWRGGVSGARGACAARGPAARPGGGLQPG